MASSVVHTWFFIITNKKNDKYFVIHIISNIVRFNTISRIYNVHCISASFMCLLTKDLDAVYVSFQLSFIQREINLWLLNSVKIDICCSGWLLQLDADDNSKDAINRFFFFFCSWTSCCYIFIFSLIILALYFVHNSI